jgi:hypothetical protein
MTAAPDSRRVRLSSKGLQYIDRSHDEGDFVFLVGDDCYRCPPLIAEFLSPRVRHLRAEDASVKSFYVETLDGGHYFSDVLSIGFGGEVVFGCDESGKRDFFCEVSGELWNWELFDATMVAEEGELDHEHLVGRLHVLAKVSEDSLDSCGPEIGRCVEIIASHFHEFSVSEVEKLHISILGLILRNAHLSLLSEDMLFELLESRILRDSSFFPLLEYVQFEFLTVDCMASAIKLLSNSFDTFNFGIWNSICRRLMLPGSIPAPGARSFLDSKIISSFPATFVAFRGKGFRLLYQGSRDGFKADDFHRCCNGHGHTATVIWSTSGFIFDGYTPLVRTSQQGYVCDDSLQSFLFTIKNPHNLQPQCFSLKSETKGYAIYDHNGYGPTFGGGHGVYVDNQCNTSKSNYTEHVGYSYNNNTCVPDSTVFTGARNFSVQEIEVFEVCSPAHVSD